MKIFPYLQLTRPANLVTAMADILAGFAVASGTVRAFLSVETPAWPSLGAPSTAALPWLLLSTVGLYGGGVVLNDVFDAPLDARERPERPIPSGRVSRERAALLGIGLLMIGVGAAFRASALSALIAAVVAMLAIVYDKYGKHTALGPINMGLCRGGNLLLGVSAWPNLLPTFWPLAFIPVVYIAAITMISRGEVHGGNRGALVGAFGLYSLVGLAIAGLAVGGPLPAWQSLPFLGLFAFLIFPPLVRAYQDRQPRNVGLAVKAGVLSLIAMNAALAATFAGWAYGLGVLVLLPISRWLARLFAVT